VKGLLGAYLVNRFARAAALRPRPRHHLFTILARLVSTTARLRSASASARVFGVSSRGTMAPRVWLTWCGAIGGDIRHRAGPDPVDRRKPAPTGAAASGWRSSAGVGHRARDAACFAPSFRRRLSITVLLWPVLSGSRSDSGRGEGCDAMLIISFIAIVRHAAWCGLLVVLAETNRCPPPVWTGLPRPRVSWLAAAVAVQRGHSGTWRELAVTDPLTASNHRQLVQAWSPRSSARAHGQPLAVCCSISRLEAINEPPRPSRGCLAIRRVAEALLGRAGLPIPAARFAVTIRPRAA